LTIQRVLRSKEQARTSYNQLSRIYDLFGRFEQKYRDKGLQMLDVKSGEKVLEIGFGTGSSIIKIAQKVGETGKVYGIDISDGMVNQTIQRLQKTGLRNCVELYRGDAVQLPYNSGFFDAIFLSFTLELFDTPEIPRVLRECKRVLRPGGRISVVSLSKAGNPGLLTRIYERFHNWFPTIADCRPIFLKQTLMTSTIAIQEACQMDMWGLKVEIVLGIKK
jgi:demethylmenaquinone methyltransferase/2-methoxy-6-polyprenyl-1,4-benzoquinol methylase